MTTREQLEARIAPYWAERPVWRGLDVFDGWIPLIDDLVTALEGTDAEFPKIQQIKTKFGGLRFYVGRCTPEQEHFIQSAEQRSLRTCEKCGDPGEGCTIRHWYWTLCKECYDVMLDR